MISPEDGAGYVLDVSGDLLFTIPAPETGRFSYLDLNAGGLILANAIAERIMIQRSYDFSDNILMDSLLGDMLLHMSPGWQYMYTGWGEYSSGMPTVYSRTGEILKEFPGKGRSESDLFMPNDSTLIYQAQDTVQWLRLPVLDRIAQIVADREKITPSPSGLEPTASVDGDVYAFALNHWSVVCNRQSGVVSYIPKPKFSEDSEIYLLWKHSLSRDGSRLLCCYDRLGVHYLNLYKATDSGFSTTPDTSIVDLGVASMFLFKEPLFSDSLCAVNYHAFTENGMIFRSYIFNLYDDNSPVGGTVLNGCVTELGDDYCSLVTINEPVPRTLSVQHLRMVGGEWLE